MHDSGFLKKSFFTKLLELFMFYEVLVQDMILQKSPQLFSHQNFEDIAFYFVMSFKPKSSDRPQGQSKTAMSLDRMKFFPLVDNEVAQASSLLLFPEKQNKTKHIP